MSAELSRVWPSEVEGIVPLSCPEMLSALRRQKLLRVATPFSNSSVLQNFVGSVST